MAVAGVFIACTAMNLIAYESFGGPRAGSGAAVRLAMVAAGIGCSAYDRACVGSNVLFNRGGGAMMLTHSGQSMLWLVTSVLPSAEMTMTFITPEPEQISCVACGLTIGEAMATPNDSTKPSNTQRANEVARRRF